MSSIGLQLIASAIDSQNVSEFVEFSLKPDLFTKTELSAFEYVNEFVYKHGKVPERETFLSEVTEIDALPLAKEPPSYYYEEIKKRHVHKTLTSGMLESKNVLLEEKNPEKALDILTESCIKLQTRKNANQMVDFREAKDTLLKSYKTKQKNPELSGIKLGWPTLDEMSGGLLGGDLVSYIGRPACLSGQTKIWVSRKKCSSGRYYTLEELYRGFNGGKAKEYKGKKWDLTIPTRINSLKEDGLTSLNEVEAVVKSGVKKLYRVTTSTGKKIEATLDHKFKVLTGGDFEGYLPLSKLGIGDSVVCRDRSTKTSKKYISKYRKEVCTKLPYSPYKIRIISGIRYNRVNFYRLVYDASINGLSVEEFIQRIKTDKDHDLIFSDSDKQIHHIDGDHYNNESSNLQLVSASEHQKIHAAEETYRERFSSYGVVDEEIVSIDYIGEDETYDITMKSPYNNFVADDFIVHNSGKTFLMLYSALNMWAEQNKKVMFVSMEMLPSILINRLASIYASVKLTHLNKAQLGSDSLKRLVSSMYEVSTKQHPFWIMDGNLTANVEDIWVNAKMLKPDVIIVDGAYLLGHPNNRLNRFERVADNCRMLKNSIATDLRVPVLTSWQFNREATKKAKKGGGDQGDLEDIGFSDEIGQLSSLVLGLYQKESVETINSREIKILKGRSGEIGKFSVNWDFYKMNFDEVNTNNNDQMKYE